VSGYARDMPASMIIDQVGIPAGVPNFSRTDGSLFGGEVTLTSVGGGATHRFELLWVPPEDTSAVASLAQSGPTEWKFTPLPGAFGTYRILLVVNEGTPSESRQIRTFAIRSPYATIVIPAANEIADPTATLANQVSRIQSSESNEAFGPFVGGSAFGWWRAFAEMAQVVEALSSGAGGGGYQAPAIIVGNAAAGDTAADCDFLENGDGTAIPLAILVAQGGMPKDIWIRPGGYQWDAMAAGFESQTITISAPITIRGAGRSMVQIQGNSLDRGMFDLDENATIMDLTITVPVYGVSGSIATHPVILTRGNAIRVDVNASSINPADNGDPFQGAIYIAENFSNTSHSSVIDCNLRGVRRLSVSVYTTKGIAVASGHDAVIERCTISDFDSGVGASGYRVKVLDNVIAGHTGAGIGLLQALGCLARGNTIKDHFALLQPVGIHLTDYASYCTISENMIQGDATVIGIFSEGTTQANRNQILGNQVACSGSPNSIVLSANTTNTIVASNVTDTGAIVDSGTGNVLAHNMVS